MKYYYLRPRQDYSIARLAKVLEILDLNGYDARIFTLREKDKKGDDKPTLCIALNSHLHSRVNEWSANHAVKKICELTDSVDRDFKVLFFEFPNKEMNEQKEEAIRKSGLRWEQ